MTLPPGAEHLAELLRDCATFLSTISAARIAELFMALLVGDGRFHHKATDLVRVISSVMIYLAALIIWLYYGLNFNITSLLATSAIFTIVIGLALQSTLGNLFSGVALELERPLCL